MRFFFFLLRTLFAFVFNRKLWNNFYALKTNQALKPTTTNTHIHSYIFIIVVLLRYICSPLTTAAHKIKDRRTYGRSDGLKIILFSNASEIRLALQYFKEGKVLLYETQKKWYLKKFICACHTYHTIHMYMYMWLRVLS